MANTTYLNRLLNQTIARSQASLAGSPVSYRTPTVWIRTITSTPPRHNQPRFTVSFGAENDALVAPHLQKLRERENKSKSKRDGKFITENTPVHGEVVSSNQKNLKTSIADSFEIDEYIDLSAKRPRYSNADPHQTSALNDGAIVYIAGTGDQLYLKEEKSGVGNDSGNVHRSLRADSPPTRRDREDKTAKQAKPKAEPSPIRKKREPWQVQKQALKEKFGEDSWNPRKKLSPDAIEGIRGLHEQDPIKYSTEVLSGQFKVSPEAIRRMLRSKWSQKISPEQMQERRERWARRHDRIWDRQAALGLRPERVKDRGIEDPDQFEKDMIRKQTLGEI